MRERLWVLVCLGVAACTAPGLPARDPIEALPQAIRDKVPESVLRSLLAGETVELTLALTPGGAGDDGIEPLDATHTRARDSWTNAKQALVATVPPSALAVVRPWEELPLVHVSAGSFDALVAALADSHVAFAAVEETLHHFDAESFPLIRQPTALASGFDGRGTSVAVLDTGVDWTHAAFGGCTAPGAPSTCRVAFARDFAPDDNSRDDNGHGTNVSGIVVGVAPGARILGLDVFQGSGASSTVIIDAINWVIANRATYNIAAMNLSLGGGSATAPCTTNAMGSAIATARAAGILAAVASGNESFTNALAQPACAPAAISVGAVYDAALGGIGYSTCSDATTAADKVACFSNSASFLSLLAPGALITAAGTTMAGTSQAAPHVAGALAVLRAAFPADSPDALVQRLISTGKAITDARNGVVTRRIDLGAAVASAATPPPPADTTPPTGSLSINNGAPVTRSPTVTLTIGGADPSGVASMCLTNGSTCTTFEPFATTRSWTLAAGDGAKTVSLFLRDAKGNTTPSTAAIKASITLDTTAPRDGALSAAVSNGAITLTWTAATDGGSGVASYRVVSASGATPPPTGCATGTVVYTGRATTIVHSGLTNGLQQSYRVCAFDVAGNVSPGATATATPKPESTPPVGSVVIENGATFTNKTTVAVSLAATDASGVPTMCLSTSATPCATWLPYATTATVAVGTGTQTVYARFRDRWGNESAPATDSIIVDTTAPTMGPLRATAGLKQIEVAWSAASDAVSGVSSYTLVGTPGTVAPPPGCATGTRLLVGTATTFIHALATGTTYSYRLCAADRAGNVAPGVTITATAR